ncbi:hypothetical protein SAMN05444371_2816 [Epilithonimonas mollis]|uniref:Uncharacterized protein n=1 Tax=Epilithonimonas mollis TaxID=216903 RepID=A0A1M6TED1_9FLAO|nr:hypothetical protein SAMN05444371_2816 [Epilithonimonas mollis]
MNKRKLLNSNLICHSDRISTAPFRFKMTKLCYECQNFVPFVVFTASPPSKIVSPLQNPLEIPQFFFLFY